MFLTYSAVKEQLLGYLLGPLLQALFFLFSGVR